MSIAVNEITNADAGATGGEGVGAELSTAAAIFPAEEAEALARERYGLDGKAKWLWGEKDSNYCLTLADGTTYLMKVLHPSENPVTTAMHSQALLHVQAADPGVPVQRVVPTRDGLADCRVTDAQGEERGVRVVTFLKGVAQGDVAHSAVQRFQVGVMLGRMQAALSDFTHTAATHKISWDLCHALDARPLLEVNPDAAECAFLTEIFARFEAEVLPLIGDLPTQVIHNDFNMANILVDPDNTDVVSGIIDFGDMVRAPRVFDVAIGGAYQIGGAEEPIAALCDFLKGYASISKLGEPEIRILYVCMLTRMAMRLAITEWRAGRFPEQADYIRRNSASIRQEFERLKAFSEDEVQRRIADACKGR